MTTNTPTTLHTTGQHFRLLGRALTFRAVRFYIVLDDVRVVVGHSLDGKLMTTARIVDTVQA